MKRKKNKEIIFSKTVLVACFILIFGSAMPAFSADLLLGATSLSSGSYVRPVAYSKCIEKYVPGVRTTVVATGASRDNLKRLGKKQIDISTITAVDTTYQAYHGVGAFKGKGVPEARAIWVDAASVNFLAVRADTGIKSLSDLQGKKIFLGNPGSSVQLTFSTVLDTLGIKIKMVTGSLGDAKVMMKDRKIDGLVKASSGEVLDAALADINTVTPLRMISFTEDEWDKVASKLKGRFLSRIPANSIAGLKSHGPVTTLGGGTLILVRKDFPEDLAYKIVKAFDEHWDEVSSAHKVIPKDPLPAFVQRLTSGKHLICPLHPGAFRYLKEKGVKFPKLAIPPEAR